MTFTVIFALFSAAAIFCIACIAIAEAVKANNWLTWIMTAIVLTAICALWWQMATKITITDEDADRLSRDLLDLPQNKRPTPSAARDQSTENGLRLE